MYEALPLFPLTTVLFPDMLLPLHIFEPRYRRMIQLCLEQNRPFGVVLIRGGDPDVESVIPHHVGTVAAIVGHTPLDDGRSFIVVKGGRRFAIRSLDAASEPYLVGSVEYLEEDEGSGSEQLADGTADAFGEYQLAVLAVTNESTADTSDIDSLGQASPREVAYRVASGMAIEAEERQRLLEAPTAQQRLTVELDLLKREKSLLTDLAVRQRAGGEGPALN